MAEYVTFGHLHTQDKRLSKNKKYHKRMLAFFYSNFFFLLKRSLEKKILKSCIIKSQQINFNILCPFGFLKRIECPIDTDTLE